jgi:hypothetical protein
MNATCDKVADVNAETRVFLVDWLPTQGRAWLHYAEANLIVLSVHLDEAGQRLALIDAGRPDLV